MAQNSSVIISKLRQRVRLIRFNESELIGNVFLFIDQRVSDLLNDYRSFVPIVLECGNVKIVSKRAIMEIDILGEQLVGDDSIDRSAVAAREEKDGDDLSIVSSVDKLVELGSSEKIEIKKLRTQKAHTEEKIQKTKRLLAQWHTE